MAFLVSQPPPCVLFEDEHLLVVNKPPGLATHAPSPYAGQGLYEWLRDREPAWASLAIMQRLDKDTSGVIAFSKSALANKSLTDQFTHREVQKKYMLLTDRRPRRSEFTVRSRIIRLGDRYTSRQGNDGVEAETHFRVLEVDGAGHHLLQAEPRTGRTHQIRVHAADHGLPILGDSLYGGSPFRRLCLHAAELNIEHPATGRPTCFQAPSEFEADPGIALREALWNPVSTNCFRLAHGAADGCPGWYLERLGEYLLSMAESENATPDRERSMAGWKRRHSIRGVYHKQLRRDPGKAGLAQASPRLIDGQSAPDWFKIQENGLHFALSLTEGYSTGLFLDQKDNRRRLLTNYVTAGFPIFEGGQPARVLNTFAYTCAFSVCAAAAGHTTVSVDLSKKYLQWGEKNFQLNNLVPGAHEFIYGDVFEWLRRLTKKKNPFDLIILDPPTFSRSKEYGHFQAENHYAHLISLALPLLKRQGVLFASTNAARLKPEAFLGSIQHALNSAGRRILQQHYVPQAPDFPITRTEPAYLKTVWTRVD